MIENLRERWERGEDPVLLSLEKWAAVLLFWKQNQSFPAHLFREFHDHGSCPLCWDAAQDCVLCLWPKRHQMTCNPQYQAAIAAMRTGHGAIAKIEQVIRFISALPRKEG